MGMKYLLLIVLLVAVVITAACVSENKETATSTPHTQDASGGSYPHPTRSAPSMLLTPFTTIQTIRAITSDDVKAHFIDIAFGEKEPGISKIFFYQISTDSASDSDIEVIHNFISDFNDLSKSNGISENIGNATGQYVLTIKFIPHLVYPASIDEPDDTISINNDLSGDQRNHTILWSLYYMNGAKGITFDYPDSLFYIEDNNNTKLTPLDKKALEILFGAGVKNGMNRDDIKKSNLF